MGPFAAILPRSNQVLIYSFASAKPRLTALKSSVSPRFFPVDLSRSERQDAVGFE